MRERYVVIIVGSGAAGLFSALSFPDNYRIMIITKKAVDESDSYLAQGGICMLRGETDYQDYFEDTMRAGHYVNEKKKEVNYDQVDLEQYKDQEALFS